MLKEILDHLKSQEICAKAIKEDLCFLKEITDDVKTQMCVKAVRTGHGYWMLFQIILNPRRCILKNLSKTQAIWLLSLLACDGDEDYLNFLDNGFLSAAVATKNKKNGRKG